jgi:hypothetical protein
VQPNAFEFDDFLLGFVQLVQVVKLDIASTHLVRQFVSRNVGAEGFQSRDIDMLFLKGCSRVGLGFHKLEVEIEVYATRSWKKRLLRGAIMLGKLFFAGRAAGSEVAFCSLSFLGTNVSALVCGRLLFLLIAFSKQ